MRKSLLLNEIRKEGASGLFLRRLLPGVAAAWAVGACAGADAEGRPDVGESVEVVAVELVRELPPGGVLADDIFLESARGFDLFGDTVAIADRLAGRVQLFRSTGEHIATLGGPLGPGDPETLKSPFRVEFAPDGTLWAGDTGRGVVAGFPPGGVEPRTARVWPATSAATFGVDHVLGPVGISGQAGFLLTAYAIGNHPLEIPSEVPIPGELALNQGNLESFINRMGQTLVVSGGRRGELVLLDGKRLVVWRIRLEYEPPRIVEILRHSLPEWLVESARADLRVMEEAFPGAIASAFKDMRAGPRGVWLTPATPVIDGVFVPYDPDARATVLWPDPMRREAWQVRILDDSAWLMYPASLQLFTIADED